MSGVRDVAAGFHDFHAWATDPRPRIGWGLSFFDSRTNNGMARQETCLMIASSSVGKTSIGLNIVRHNHDVPTLIFSMEMSWRMVVARMMAMEHGMTTTALELETKSTGHLPAEAQSVADKFRNLVCDDTSGITLRAAEKSFEDATQALGEAPRLVIWDFAELIGGGSGLQAKAESMDKTFTKLHDWTRNFDTSSLVLHQRGMNDKGWEPVNLNDGRYGGHTLADFVVGAYAPRLEPGISASQFRAVEEEVWLQLLKNRSGKEHPAGIKHRLDTRTMRLSEWHPESERLRLAYPAPKAYQESF